MITTGTKSRIRGSENEPGRLVRPFGITAAPLTGMAGFQTALALGAPWGDHVWGRSFAGSARMRAGR